MKRVHIRKLLKSLLGLVFVLAWGVSASQADSRTSNSTITISGDVQVSYFFAPSDTLVSFGLGGIVVKAVDEGTSVVSDSTVTDSTGFYELLVDTNWSGTVVADAGKFPFWNTVNPPQINVFQLAGSVTSQNFTISHVTTTEWAQDGLQVTDSLGAQSRPHIAIEGDGGAVIVWQDDRSSSTDIYAQRIYRDGDTFWTGDGVVITTATGNQLNPRVAPNGYHGAVVCWQDARAGSTGNDIYMQRINAWGDIAGQENGLAVCTAPGEQTFPQITTDAAGEPVIVWMDARSGEADIYAMVQSIDNKVAICTALGVQSLPRITSSGPAEVTSGAIITWQDGRDLASTGLDIYAQRVDYRSHGVAWATDGVAICDAAQSQTNLEIVPDGFGGAIITWMDNRDFGLDIYAERVDVAGATVWGDSNGVAVCIASGVQLAPKLAPDGLGGAVITWFDMRSGGFDIYAQYVDANGTAQWTNDGIPISNAAGAQSLPEIVADGGGNVVITWTDERGADKDIYAQRVALDSLGTVFWDSNGVVISSLVGDQDQVQIATDISSAGGVFFAWRDKRGADTDIYAWRTKAPYSISGRVTTEDGFDIQGIQLEAIEFNDLNSQTNVSATSTTGSVGKYTLQLEEDWSGVVVPKADEFFDQFLPGLPRLYGKLTSNITNQDYIAFHDGVGGAAVSDADGDQINPQACSDSAGGAIIVWQDDRPSSPDTDIFAQRRGFDGTNKWQDDGVSISRASGIQSDPQIAPNDSGGAFITWVDERGSTKDIYAQRVDSLGNISWTANGGHGIVICDAGGDQSSPRVVSDESGGAYIVWVDERGPNKDLYGIRIDANGDRLTGWTLNGVAITTATNDQDTPDIYPDGTGGLLVAWQDYRNSATPDIFAQRMSTAGSPLWGTNGKRISEEPGDSDKRNPQLTSDGDEGAIIVWQDKRSGSFEIYAHRVTGSGAFPPIGSQWFISEVVPPFQQGVKVGTSSPAGKDLLVPQLVPDGQGGAIIAWEDHSEDFDIKAERVDSDGVLQWALGSPDPPARIGTEVVNTDDAQTSLRIISDGDDGAIISWEDDRDGTVNIFAQNMDALGEQQWLPNGVPITDGDGEQTNHQTISNGTGGVIAAWQDDRAGEFDIDIYADNLNDQVLPTVAFDIASDDSFLVGCPQGDQDEFKVIIDFHGAHYLFNDVPNTDFELLAPDSVVVFFHDNPIVATNDVSAANDFRTTIVHSFIGGCGTDSATVDLQGEALATKIFDTKSFDFGGDGSVSLNDLAIFAVAFGDSGSCFGDSIYNDCADFDNDSCVVEADNSLFVVHFHHQKPSGGSSPQIAESYPESETGVSIITSKRVSGSQKAQLQAIISLTNAEDISIAAIALNNDHLKLRYVDWQPSDTFGGTVILAPVVRNGRKIVFLTVFDFDEPIGGDVVELGTITYDDLGSRVGDNDFELLVGEFLTTQNRIMRLKGVVLDEQLPPLPLRNSLAQNYPNPFNPTTTIEYTIAAVTHVDLSIYNVMGQLVRKLVNEQQTPKAYTVRWNGKSNQGQRVASGAYFYRLLTNKYVSTKKLILLR